MVREDGSMQMLGEHGREYTWVNPNDRIYTASQTSAILGNNSIEGLSRGIRNKILGYYRGG
mgnify:CR=1 FL=1